MSLYRRNLLKQGLNYTYFFDGFIPFLYLNQISNFLKGIKELHKLIMKHLNMEIKQCICNQLSSLQIMCSDFPFPLSCLQPVTLKQLVDLLLLMFSPQQNTEDKRAKPFGNIEKKSVKIMLKTENKEERP